uniref:Uncharacterized protein n=1 Tax=Melopsittacus undulatus TaxID=13146 RepID=A0A8V5GDU6_MELUD
MKTFCGNTGALSFTSITTIKFISRCSSRSSWCCRMSSAYFIPFFPVSRAREKCKFDPRL